MTTFRYMISEAAQHGLEVDHLDVVTAFLNPKVDENVYMVLPEGVPEANTIVKLKKALYRLKTAPRLWHKTTNAFLLSLKFIQSEADPNLYIRRDKGDGNKDPENMYTRARTVQIGQNQASQFFTLLATGGSVMGSVGGSVGGSGDRKSVV